MPFIKFTSKWGLSNYRAPIKSSENYKTELRKRKKKSADSKYAYNSIALEMAFTPISLSTVDIASRFIPHIAE